MSRGTMMMGMASAAFVALALAAPAAAQDGGSAPEPGRGLPLSIELRAGLEYDSNVAVLELDRTSGQGDLAAQLELGVGFDRRAGERLRFNAGYNFSEKLYNDFGEFDLRIHRGSGSMSRDLGRGAGTGVTGHYISASLDGGDFLVMRQVTPHYQKLFGTRLFLRLAYTHTEKNFKTNADRTASANTFSSDTFVFLNGLATYLVIGYRHDREDAAAGHFDYTGNRFRLQLTHRLPVGARQLTLRGQARYEYRHYHEPTPVLDERRKDDRVQLEALAELPLTERTVFRLSYRHADNRSNLPSVDFDEHLWSMGFSFRW